MVCGGCLMMLVWLVCVSRYVSRMLVVGVFCGV